MYDLSREVSGIPEKSAEAIVAVFLLKDKAKG